MHSISVKGQKENKTGCVGERRGGGAVKRRLKRDGAHKKNNPGLSLLRSDVERSSASLALYRKGILIFVIGPFNPFSRC